MRYLNYLWKSLTSTNALEQTSGKYEMAFFESVYRVVYLSGLSRSDTGWLYMTYSNAIKLLIYSLMLSEIWALFTMCSSLDDVIDSLNVITIHMLSVYRYWNLINHNDIFKKLAMAMESPNFDIASTKRQRIFDFWLNNNAIYFKVLLTLGNCTLAAWYVYPLLDELEYNLGVNIWIPFNYENPSLYATTYVVIVVALNYASHFVMVNDLIMQAHLMHLLCQFDVLADCFENILEDCSLDFDGLDKDTLHTNLRFIEKYITRLGQLVEQHKFILNHTLQLRAILSKPMLGQLAASGFLICCVGYQVTATITAGIAKFLTSLLYLGYNMFELFIFCRWCDEIKMQSEKIREAVYFSGWERMAMVPGVRARLMLIVARASHPLVLSAGGLYDLSLSSYATLMKTSYSALTVLLRVRRD